MIVIFQVIQNNDLMFQVTENNDRYISSNSK